MRHSFTLRKCRVYAVPFIILRFRQEVKPCRKAGATPTALRTLSDVVYVANVLACAHFDWLYPDFDPERGDIGLVRSSFADILPEIENDAQEMMAVFS